MLCFGRDVFLYGPSLYRLVVVAKSIFVLRLAFDVRIFRDVDTGLRNTGLRKYDIQRKHRQI